MNITPSDIIAIIGALTGAGGLLAAWRTSRSSAKKNDVEALREIIEGQSKYIEEQAKRIEKQDSQIEKQDERIGVLEAQVKTWQRRFMRLCTKYNISPDSEITGPMKAVSNAPE